MATKVEVNIWENAGRYVFFTTVSRIKAAGGRREATLPNSSLRVGDVIWTPEPMVPSPDRWVRFFNYHTFIIFNQ